RVAGLAPGAMPASGPTPALPASDPGPFGATPNPEMARSAPGMGGADALPHGATGAPTARTFGGEQAVPRKPNVAVIAVLGLVGLVMIGGAVGGGVLVY